MSTTAWVVLVVLVGAISYRVGLLVSIHRMGGEVRWTVPIVRWIRKARGDDDPR